MAVAAADFTGEQLRMIGDGTELVRRAAAGSTDARVGLAGLLVDLRATFTDAQGRPDYAGGSGPYRAAVYRVYHDADLEKKERDRVKWGVQHHLHHALRERLTPEQLDAYGLNTRARNETRTQRSDKAKTPARTGADFLARVKATRARAEEADAEELADLTPELAAEIREQLNATITLYRAMITRLDVHLGPEAC